MKTHLFAPLSFVLIAVFLTASPSSTALAQGEIGYVEDFSLATDRAEALKLLIPGTRDYYYYTALHLQNQGKYDEVDKILGQWIKRHKSSGRTKEIQNRQALLRYTENAKKSLDYLRRELGLSFSHQQERLDQKPNLPNALDPNRISRKTLLARAFSHSRGIDRLEYSALDWVLRTQVKLDSTRRRHLLSILKHPDYPGLVELIAADLKTKESRGFGSFAIHRALLPDQLDELRENLPELIRNTNYVNAVISKMLPSEDINWKADREAFGAYLARVWGFVRNLDPAFNSLKANTLHQLLSWHRANGDYPKDLFMEYVKMPRQLHYVNPDYLKGQTIQVRNHLVDLNRDFQKVNHCPPVGNDEALLRAFFLHYFIKEATFIPYAKYIRDTWLKPVFAEAKIVNGVGDQEKWFAMLSPGAYQALKERIDIEFAATNPKQFAPGDAVSLDVHVKNVRKLIVKVYEINALNVYLETNREVSTDLNLDGLVANFEEKHAFEESPLRRVRRTFKIPALAGKRGTWIVELIGNGRSSRAVVRKGRLQFLARTTAAGTGFTVLDQDNKRAKAPAVWMGGRKFTPGKGKEIVVPFSTKPGSTPVVLTAGNLATLAHHQHPGENYRLSAGFHVDREALLGGAKAELAIRARLSLNGVPVPIGLLEEVKLTVSSVDLDGIAASQVVTALKLDDKGEFTHTLSVPQRLRGLAVQLSGKIRSVSQAKDLPLVAQRSFAVNGIDASAHVDDVHLSKFGDGHVLEVFGRNGEPLAERAVQVNVKHRDFKQVVHTPLMTDAAGRVQLGVLVDIVWITAAGPSGQTRRWNLLEDRHSLPGNVHGAEGAPVNVAYMGDEEEAQRGEFALLELRGGTFTSDRFASLRIEDGMVVADGLPAGDYKLVLRPSGREINLRVGKGEAGHGHVLGAHRHLQVVNYQPLQIRSVKKAGKNLVIRIDNGQAEWARVHVIANRFYPEFRLDGGLGGVEAPEPFEITRAHVPSLYISGRDIGEEYRYIIERQYAKKFPGNMLTRPGLLLNPWAVRTTETSKQDAQAGGVYGRRGTGSKGGAAAGGPGQGKGGGDVSGYANLEFLTDTSICLYNLRADKNGVITIPLKDLGDRQHVHVLAADPRNSALRHIALAERGTKFQDLRLRNGIDPAGHFTQAKRISAVEAKDKVTITDPRSSRFEVYDTVGKVYTLFRTLNPDPKLAEFQFILDWPQMDDEKKRAKYKEFACHELHFFLAHRDPEFFKAVVKPYIAHKKDKTFLDDYLIGADLGRYLKPWFYNRLNMVEKILLARRIKDEHAATARHVKDRFDLILPDRDRFDHLFRTALVGQALAADGGAAGSIEGIEMALGEAEESAPMDASDAVWASAGGERRARDAKPGMPAPSATPKPMPVLAGLDKKKQAMAKSEGKKDAPRKMIERLESRLEGESLQMARDLGSIEEVRKLRSKQRAFYRKMPKTQEWAENNYYKVRIVEQLGGLVEVNAFWKDYAAWDGKGKFLSPHVAESTRNFTEMMLAISVLDVPFEAAEHDAKAVDGNLEITLGSPAVVFHREVLPAETVKGKTTLMVGQNFFRHGDRYTHVDNERVDKFVTDEFLKGVVYGCQVVVTNPTSSVQKLDLLVQIPRMALPIARSRTTASFPLRLEPFSTHKMEYHFYFPASSGEKTFAQFPVHVGKDETAMAWADPFAFKVVDKLSNIDKASWDYISQFGSEEDVIAFLHEHNIDRIKVERIAWRVRDVKFFDKVIPLLQKRRIYNPTLWSYGIYHNKVPQIRQFLLHSDGFLKRCGDWIDCELVTIDPVERRAYEHLEYSPLVNARAHQLGKRRRILNNYFHQQYHRLMKILTYRPQLDDADNMSVAYYLFLQDRVEEGLAHFDKVNARRLPTKLQHDYMSCYAAFYREKPAEARAIAARYAEFPAERWRGLFAQVVTQADAIRGAAGEAAVHDKDDREQLQDELASTEPSIDLKVENRKVEIAFQNLKQVTVNYYRMDLEFLFSTNPFVGSESKRFGTIRPNKSATVRLPAGKEKHGFDLPKEFHGDNVLVEVVAAGLRKAQAYYSNDLRVQLVENYGRVEVRDAKSGKPLPRVYVKVYAETPGAAKPKFFKDGYTDLRGKFDYTSLNTGDIDQISRFSILILSETHGAVVREAKPPKR